MSNETSATIFALASAPGKAGVSVFRLSGAKAGATLAALTGLAVADMVPRKLVRASLRDALGETIDDGLVAWFPAPHSFTGEDVAELQLHGGRAVANALGDALVALGLRPAEPGEFSRRAFLAGKLDLTRAEGIADLVEAETAAQRRQALRQMGGALADADRWLAGAAAACAGASRSRDRFRRGGVAAGARAPRPARCSRAWPTRWPRAWPISAAASGCATGSRWPCWARPMPVNQALSIV